MSGQGDFEKMAELEVEAEMAIGQPSSLEAVQAARADATFAEIDTDGDGLLTRVRGVPHDRGGLHAEEVANAGSSALRHRQGRGSSQRRNFAWFSRSCGTALRPAFGYQIDTDGDGFLSRAESDRIHHQAGRHREEPKFDELDTDQDRKVSEEEL